MPSLAKTLIRCSDCYTVTHVYGTRSKHDGGLHPAGIAFLTADLPGVGGILKQQADDFVVEEIPAYLPEGQGEFLFLWVEKTGLSAEQLTSHVARALKIAHQDIAWPVSKIVTPSRGNSCPSPYVASPSEGDLARRKFASCRSNGIGTTSSRHLRGNRFSILLRETEPEAVVRAQAIAERVSRLGFPNYFGDQRFGRDSETLELGLELLRGTKMPGDIPRARRKFLLRLSLSPCSRRCSIRLLPPVSRRHAASRAPGRRDAGRGFAWSFRGRRFVTGTTRFDSGEIAIAGPIFGPKMLPATGETAAREAALLSGAQLDAQTFTKFANLTSGTRRAYGVRPEKLELEAEATGLRLSFTLPSGCYATVLLREFQKT